jgi:hypothetical protein
MASRKDDLPQLLKRLVQFSPWKSKSPPRPELGLDGLCLPPTYLFPIVAARLTWGRIRVKRYLHN